MYLKICENITKLNIESQNQKLRLFIKLDLKTKIEIFENHKIIFHKLNNKNKSIEHSILSYCAFLLSLDNFQKNTTEETIKIIKFKKMKQPKTRKKEKLLQYYPLVKQLKQANTSYRDISDYLLKYHKFKISYSTICKLCNKIEKEESK
ncbi:hypothetical protein ACOTVP_03630 [Aliarcobacter butzleri]|uniref:hypothetical protein n=1 Tax=Aliarcobacter butzleri TaxID=28197 RepID=UPI0021B32647|nr:hypothetical protein [Aliarcobacter butzleri]UXC30118.1 hypothetical protein N3114_03690 [Aliarcobacter butzleri]